VKPVPMNIRVERKGLSRKSRRKKRNEPRGDGGRGSHLFGPAHITRKKANDTELMVVTREHASEKRGTKKKIRQKD